VRNILDFPKQFTPPARIITLDRNYRSTQPILAAANAVIDQERHTDSHVRVCRGRVLLT
jgi:DNA helicase II / ATP-dependent DNA helicase PcrA